MIKYILPIALTGLLASCDASKKATETSEIRKNSGKEDSQEEKSEFASIDIEYIDQSVRPQDDFFQFSNGKWLVENPVPPSESRWGSFNELEKSNNKKLIAILEDAKDLSAHKESDMQLLGAYYNSYIDLENRGKLGLSPIQSEIDEVLEISKKSDIIKVVAHHHELGINSLFRFGVRQDMKNVDQHIVGFWQGGIGLPSKEYYLNEDKSDILKAYTAHINRILTHAGIENTGEKAQQIVQLETMLAKGMMAPSELRIPENTYNLFNFNEFANKFTNLNLYDYVKYSGIQKFEKFVVGQPEYAAQIHILFDKIDLDTWKNYLLWKVLNHYADQLDRSMMVENFNFYGKVLTGKSEMKSIEEQAIADITNSEFSELLGKVFVGRHFSETAQQRVNEMVDNLLSVFQERIDNLDWMTEVTKKEAQVKLNAIGRKLGFPSKSEDFSSLVFTPTNLVENNKAVARYARAKNLKKLNEKVDKEEWGMPAHMINAYYHPLLNEIVFPAGIMQAPFFSESFEDAVNYGRIGMVIGHEFTHGFDDMGSKFAADGSFTNWWSEDDRAAFEKRTSTLGTTFKGFCPIEGHCVNSELTMGENIADLGGLTMAYYAYAKTKEFKSGKLVNGYTPAQRFFIAYAQLWKINYTEEELKNRIANDSHSPGMYRVNGPLMNCPEFFDAFKVKESDPMRNPQEKVARIW